jgi:eukaryotic-like serine/threonine-protein kinase
MAEIATGTLIDSRYKVISRVGSGGMADVFLAEDQQLGRKVALKLLHRRFAEDPGFVERFRREAQAAAGLQHPNVVSVYDRGAYDDTYYIAMEYLPGRSLKQLIRDEAPLDPVRAIDITIQILKAARFAHRHGVIHRDLKPHNVIVDDSDHAKVTDFGIARAGASDMTETGSIMGTAQYLSPEQAQGHAVSAGSDLYSIGVVLYELLTGRVPFDADAAVTIALKHVSEAPTAPARVNPNVPPELQQVVMWALNKSPADRPADADQFIAALEQVKAIIVSGARGQRTASMAALVGAGVGGDMPATGTASNTAADMPPPTEQDGNGDAAAALAAGEEPPDGRRRPSRRRWAWIAALVALLLAGGAVAAYLLTRPAKKVVVPTVVLEQVSVAQTQLQNAGFHWSVTYRTDSHPSGNVIAQDPLGGTKADQSSTVALTVSSGPGTTTVPSVQGLPLATAKSQLTAAGLKPGRVVQLTSTRFPVGQVTGTDPLAGANPQVGTSVTIFVSSGRPLVTVPDVTNQAQSAARATLEQAGFKIGTVTTQTSTTVQPGNVISQSPSGNTQATQGATVDLVVAKAPTTATVPTVTGQTQGTASSALTGAGFKVQTQTKNVTKKKNDGIVVSQTPAGGSTANKGSTVTIVVGHFTSPPPTSTSTTTPSTTTTTSTTTPTTTT